MHILHIFIVCMHASSSSWSNVYFYEWNKLIYDQANHDESRDSELDWREAF